MEISLHVSALQVAQYIKFEMPVLRSFIQKLEEEEDREVKKLMRKYAECALLRGGAELKGHSWGAQLGARNSFAGQAASLMHAQAFAFCIIQSFLGNVDEKSSLLLLQKCCSGANPCNNARLAVQRQLPPVCSPGAEFGCSLCTSHQEVWASSLSISDLCLSRCSRELGSIGNLSSICFEELSKRKRGAPVPPKL